MASVGVRSMLLPITQITDRQYSDSDPRACKLHDYCLVEPEPVRSLSREYKYIRTSVSPRVREKDVPRGS